MGAATIVAQLPERIETVFLNATNELSPNGFYAVKLQALGVPHTVVIDDYLPLVHNEAKNTWQTEFTTISEDPSKSPLWPVMLEKALAKYYGNYSHLTGVDTLTALSALAGGPVERITLQDLKNSDALWDKIKKHHE